MKLDTNVGLLRNRLAICSLLCARLTTKEDKVIKITEKSVDNLKLHSNSLCGMRGPLQHTSGLHVLLQRTPSSHSFSWKPVCICVHEYVHACV